MRTKTNFRPSDFEELLPTTTSNQCGISTLQRERLFEATNSVTLLTFSLGLDFGHLKALVSKL